MSQEAFDRLEHHMTQLIHMVAENNASFKRLEQRFDNLEQRFDKLEQRFETEKELNRVRHNELIKEIRNNHYDIDYLRVQFSGHDMQLNQLRMQVLEMARPQG